MYGDETKMHVVGTPLSMLEVGTTATPNFLLRIFLRAPKGTLLMIVGYDCGEEYLSHTAFRYNVEIFEVSGAGTFNVGRPLRGYGVQTEEEMRRGVLFHYLPNLLEGKLSVKEDDGPIYILLERGRQ